MAKIWMYAHGGSGNHGCEAIVRSTCSIVNELSEDLMLISSNPAEDEEYGVNQLCSIKHERLPYCKMSWSFMYAYASLKCKGDYLPMDKLNYKKTIDCIKKGDIAMSIGGDNYCYADVEKYIMLHDMMLERGAKTVLWGCSIEPKLLERKEIVADLKRYSLITARETITYNAIRKVNPNTVLVTDPAFLLQPDCKQNLVQFERGNTVGINLSPMVQQSERVDGITLSCYTSLIETILNKTDMGIALIPHVIWPSGDDRILLEQLYEKFRGSGRVVLVQDQNCSSLKYVISQCRFFVGARTHATIAAYSSCVPTLVLGYSVKSRGIARDIFGTEENYVLPVQSLQHSDDLARAFQWIQENENEIRYKLERVMPAYVESAYAAGDAVRALV